MRKTSLTYVKQTLAIKPTYFISKTTEPAL